FLGSTYDKDALLPSRVIARYPTPLRYPGGKQRLGHFFAQLLRRNNLVGSDYLEPFAGGAGVGLYLLQGGLVNSIRLNDADRSIYAFWLSATRWKDALRNMIELMTITVGEWGRQKE